MRRSQKESCCNEKQMGSILLLVEARLYKSDIDNAKNIDEELFGFRIIVLYDTYLNAIMLKSATILDQEWDLLYEDTAVFNPRLKSLLDEYNKNTDNRIRQARDIRADQLNYKEMQYLI